MDERKLKKMIRLDDKVAVITGAGQGLGRSHAIHLASLGASLVINDISSEGANTVVSEILSAGGKAIAAIGDVSQPTVASQVLKTACDHFGRLDTLVNNAGILRDRTLLKMSSADWSEVLRVHLDGTFFCMRNAIQRMVDQGNGGSIVNTTSVSGMFGNFGQGNYATAKAGIYGLTLTAAIELRKYHIRVNAIAPIAFTQMTENLPMMKQRPEANREFSPDHVPPVVAFLASDQARDISGKVIAVEGRALSLFQMTQTVPLVAESDVWTAQQVHDAWTKLVQSPPRNISNQ